MPFVHAIRHASALRRRAALPVLFLAAFVGAPAGPGAAFPQWANDTAAVGIDFQLAGEIHPADQMGPIWPAFPEIFGGGACFADFDGDGLVDLYLVNQQFNPENEAYGAWVDTVDPTNELYLNQGDGTLADVTEDAGVESRSFGYGCSAADYDGDGDVDLYVAGFGVSELYRNDGGALFTDVSAAAGVDLGHSCGDFECMATSSTWGDYDDDGDLDLYVGKYVETILHDLGRSPHFHIAQKNWLFRNDGDGTFTEVADAAGVAGLPADENGSKTLGVAWFDCDLDGDLDLFAANDETPDDFYRNNGDGTFVEFDDAGLADPRAGMGVAVADYDSDGYPDVTFTHFAGEENGFYRNNQDCTFEDRSGEDELHNNFDFVGWGVSFTDLDRDADLDLVVANGETEQLRDYEEPIKLYRQDANGDPEALPWDKEWVEATGIAGDDLNDEREERVHRGLAVADYDYDGDVDMVSLPNANASAKFLRGSGADGHWLHLGLRQSGPNAHAVGARVALEAAGAVQYREVQAGTSYLSQNPTTLDFGLGTALAADRITIEWPAGGTTVVEDVGADQVVRLDRATGALVADTLSPLTTAHLTGTPGKAGWWRSAVEATATAADRGVTQVSGLVGTEYRLGDGPWSPYTGQAFGFADEGVHRLFFRSLDAAGNLEPPRLQKVQIDLLPPSLSFTLRGAAGQNGWWVGPDVTVRLEAADALSGVDEIRYSLDGGEWTLFDGVFAIEEDGVHHVDFTATDRAGNAAPAGSFDVRLDHTKPDVALVRPEAGGVYVGDEEVARSGAPSALLLTGPGVAEAWGTRFGVEAAAGDAASGLDDVTFLLDGAVVATDADAPFTWSWATERETWGQHRVAATARDQAGNEARVEVPVALVAATAEAVGQTLEDGPRLEPAPAGTGGPPAAPLDPIRLVFSPA